MSRPGWNYDNTLTRSTRLSFYNKDGLEVGHTYVVAAMERVLESKPASQSTKPGLKGQFTIPTNWDYKWGRWTGTGSAWFESGIGTDFYRSYQSDGPIFGSLGFDPFDFYRFPTWVRSMLEIRALNKLRNQNVNLGVMLAEAGETAALFQSTCLSIARQVRRFKRQRPGDFSLARRFEGTADWRKTPQAWLELQYGWSPLLNDVQGACLALESEARRGGIFVVKADWKIRQTQTYEQGCFWIDTLQNVSIDGRARIKLAYSLRDFILVLFSQLGLVNPLEIVWERFPYSFVIDWMLPVGSWLSALSGDFGYDFVSGDYGEFVRYVDSTASVVGNSSYKNPSGPSVNGEAVSCRRRVYVSSPIPGLYLKSPVSATHIANASSLLASSFGR